MPKESEETEMKKDIEWLKNRINDKLNFGIFGPSDDVEIGYQTAMKEVLELIDELGEQQKSRHFMPDLSEKAKKERLEQRREMEKLIEKHSKGSKKESRYERIMEGLMKVARHEKRY